jgi:6-pyruvoyltetrahydropterin/6-carboxytetrahydropterin synthase
MISVTKVVEWEMGHRIPNHKGKCRFPHGHHYRLEATFSGKISQDKGSSSEGMVCDFSDLKAILKTRIYDNLDHRFAVYKKDTTLRSCFGEKIEKDLNFFVTDFIPTTENLMLWCAKQIKNDLPSKLTLIHIKLYESSKHWAETSSNYLNGL